MYRKSDSFLAPVEAAETPACVYELYPAFDIGDEIFSRIEVLAERIAAEKSVVIDGYEGVLWEKFIESLVRALESQGRKVAAIPVAGALKSEEEIDTLIAPFMGEKLRGEADYRFIAVEPASCPSFTRGKCAYDFCDTGMVCPLAKMYTLGYGFIPSANHAGGLRYHGMSPVLWQL